MKKLILIASIFALSNTGICQKNTMINTKDIAPFSFGAMPVVFASVDKGPGLGLELNSRYALSEDFGVAIFGRMKSILEEGDHYYDEYDPIDNSLESTNVFAVGAAIDYHLFRAIVLQLRGGYEAEADPVAREMNPRFIYGGGLIINFSQSQTHKIAHSLRIGVDFESDRTLDVDFPTVDFSDFPYSQSAGTSNGSINAFSIQVGWNFQFHGIKRKR